ncbi:MAG: ankyrin repeat domain-containing protein [Desulfomonile tiedjei]|nr:ankyrin repeat domain-containing protein [Desulfomonile tiedjei]
MRSAYRLVLCLIVSGLVLVSGQGTADITPMDYSPPPSGGGVSPKSPHPTIRLDDQEVIIRLKPFTYTVDAVFHLSNTGETATQWIGFPKNATGRGPGPHGKVRDFIRFEVTVNQNKVPFTEERELVKPVSDHRNRSVSRVEKHSAWLVGQAAFPGNATTTIRVRYEAPYDHCGMGCTKAVYIYGTGGYWKDSIGKAAFIVDSTEKRDTDRARVQFSVSEAEKHAIRKRVISENIAKYVIQDFEPNPDSALTVAFTKRQLGMSGDVNELIHAAMNGRLEQVQALLKKGVDVNASSGFGGQSPLMSAAYGGHLKVAKLLVEKGADVNAETKDGKTALKEALGQAWLGRGQLEVAKFLRDRGAKPKTLSVAAFVGDMDTVQALAADGVDSNAKDTLDEPAPLKAAAMGDRTDVVKFLLDKGFPVDAKSKQGQTALMVAAAAGHAEVVQLLLDRGADVNAQDVHLRTALNGAVWLRGHLEAAKVLLDSGANIHARDDPAGRTVLIHAAQGGHLKLVRLLLERGADVNARDNAGRTALSLVQGEDIEEIEKVLKAHGAKK